MKKLSLFAGCLLLVLGAESLAAQSPDAAAAANRPPVLEKVARLVAQDAPYRDLDLLDQPQVSLRVVRSKGVKTGFDFANAGQVAPVDVIHYQSPSSANEDLIAGPTLVFHRGATTKVTLFNDLDASEQPVLSVQDGCEIGTPPDVWKQDAADDLFGTNLHTHGLHISPTGLHDNVFLNVAPQASVTLEYSLPATHRAGTFWYHAHRHDSVAYQITNGMAGALIVPGQPKADPASPDTAADDLEAIPEVVQANQIPGVQGNFGRVMLIQQFRFAQTRGQTPDSQPIWVVDPADISDRMQARPADNAGRITADILPDNSDSPGAALPTRYTDVLSTNGVRGPVIQMRRGCVERWRFIDAGIESSIDARWYKWNGSRLTPMNDGAIHMYEVALDGTPTGYLDDVSSLNLRPGYRSDLLVRISKDAKPGDKYVLFTDETAPLHQTRRRSSRPTPQSGRPLPAKKVPPEAIAVVEIGQQTQVMALPAASAFARWKIQTPLVPQQARTVAFHFIDADPPPSIEPHGASGEFGITENGVQKPYAQTKGVEALPLQIGRVDEWTVMVDNGSHPFHIHVNPFQVQDPRYKDGDGRWVWRDTLLVDAGSGPQKIRLKPEDFAGRSVLHCHILDHEDQGMMKDIDILDANGHESLATTFLQPVTGRDAHDLPTEIVPSVGKPQVLVVYTGVQCPHCVAALRELAGASAGLKNADVTAISALPVPSDARRRLGLAPTARLRLAVQVPDRAAFERLGLIDADGLVDHAVLVFNAAGKETFRYVGTQPLPDVREIPHALARLTTTD